MKVWGFLCNNVLEYPTIIVIFNIMKGIELLKHYFTSEVIERFIINTCHGEDFLPISSECNSYFHKEIGGIMDACSFIEGSFLWSDTPEDSNYWYNKLTPITKQIRNNGLPMGLTIIKPRHNIKHHKFT